MSRCLIALRFCTKAGCFGWDLLDTEIDPSLVTAEGKAIAAMRLSSL